jgi:hypothetical protein
MEKKYKNGARYVGSIQNDKRHGEGTYYYTDGSSHKGTWKNGEKHGYGVHTSASGNVKTGQWETGEYVGECKTSYKSTSSTTSTKSSSYSSSCAPSSAPSSSSNSYSSSSKPNKMTNNKTKGNILGSLGLDFGKYTGDQLAFSPAGIAVRKKDGEYVVYDKANKQLISIGELKMDIPFYKVPVAYDGIQVGDLINVDGSFYTVEEKTANKGLKCISPTTGSVTHKIAKNNLYGMYFYTKIISLLDGAGAATGATPGSPLGGINPLMLLALGKGENGGSDNMMQMLMLSQLGGGAGFGGAAGGINPLMLMALSGNGEGGSDDLMQMLLFSQLGGGASPLGGIFGQPVAPVAAPVAPAAPKRARAKK